MTNLNHSLINLPRTTIIFFTIFIFLLPFPCFAEKQINLLEKNGTVEIFKSGKEGFEDLTENTNIEKNDKIRTGEHSFCRINWNNNILYIGENSDVEIRKVYENNTDEVFLLSGEVAAKLKNMPASSRFRVETPSSMCAARGTLFLVKHGKSQGLTETACLENQIIAETSYDIDKAVILNAGQRTHLCPWENAKIHVTGTGLISEKFISAQALKPNSGAKIKKVLKTNHSAGSRKEIIHKKITTAAKQHIADRILSMSVGGELTVRDVLSNPEKLKKFHSFIDKETKIIKASIETETAMIEVELELQKIEDIIEKKIICRTDKIEDITESEYSAKFGALAKVTTTRAAEVDAYRKLAEKIHGTVIQSNTIIKDFVVSNDTVKIKIEGIVKGATKLETKYFSDGSVTVAMTIDAIVLKNNLSPDVGDVFGTIYLPSPESVNYSDYAYQAVIEGS